MVVVVEPRLSSVVRQAQIVGGNSSDILHFIPGDEKVFPTVVIIIKEPGGKAGQRLGHAGMSSDVAELPLTGRVRAIVVKQLVGRSENREVQVWPAIVIVICTSDTFDEGFHIQTARGRALGEASVMVVVEQFARVGIIGIGRFVALEEVQPAIAVVNEPDASLGGMTPQKGRLFGHIGEGAIAVVAQQRAGNPSLFVEPSSALDPNVKEPVVIIVGLLDVQAAGQAQETSLGSTFGEVAIAIVMEVAKLALQVVGRNHHVDETVIIEIIQDAAPGQSIYVKTQGCGHIGEPWQVVLGLKSFGWDEPLGGYSLRVFAQGHGGDVKQPAGAKVTRVFSQLLFQHRNGSARAPRDFMESGRLERKEAVLGSVEEQTIFLLAQAQQGNSFGHAEGGSPPLLNRLVERAGQ